MKTWLVWESEYPEEGSTEIEAWTSKGAIRQYRRLTIGRGRPDSTPLDAIEATADILAARKAADP